MQNRFCNVGPLRLMYVFAVAMTQLLHGTTVGEKYYHSVPRSMYTLWIHGVLLDDVGVMANRLLREDWFYVGVYFFYILLAALTVMNMLIGVLCEVVSATAATEKEDQRAENGGLDPSWLDFALFGGTPIFRPEVPK